VGQPADTVQPVAQGMSLERAYFPTGAACPKDACDPIQFARVGDKVNVRLSLNVPHDMYFVSVSDFIPAGAEILDTSLNTSQLGTGEQPQAEMTFNPRQPFKNGFGMANFGQPQVYDDHISWTAEYLPAGAYELVYTLVMLQPGQYRAIPAQTKAIYFPDVQANTAGSVFEIKP
jgi:alpha-2-macroglobulin